MDCNWLDLSICSAGGLTTPQTTKLKGQLHNQDIFLLIDSGANHNFILQRLVEELGLKMDQTKPSDHTWTLIIGPHQSQDGPLTNAPATFQCVMNST
uniref:Uncharacterized protein n=1 Tax=Cajanus cajan TaxID=3821 RepID=A0A151TCP2_CAJCA|nr:hypothetical protein KK1_019427 [Cajanus cajan]